MTTTSPVINSEQMGVVQETMPASTPQWIILGQVFARWAMWATVIVSGLLGLEVDLGLGRIVSLVVMAFLGFAFVSLGEGLALLFWNVLRFLLPRLRLSTLAAYLEAVPPVMVGRILGVFLYIAGDLLWPESFFQHIMIPPVGEMAIILAGGTGVMVTLARQGGRTGRQRAALIGIPLLVCGVYLVWVFQPGSDRHLAQLAAVTPVSMPDLPDPGLPGRYPVQTVTYGTGTMTRRPEFGADVGLITRPVDGSQIFAGYQGMGGSYFQWYWGFDFTQLPLNGLVWFPVGDGPFPLVLIVHGNHAMTEFSDPGYAYLAEHLASHGYIAVAVDENYLNGIIFLDGNMEEIPLRGWLLLKHLQEWEHWNDTPGNPFYEQVDLEHVALIGHSRGGEAVAVAASLNERVTPPVSRVSSAHEFSFGIDAVIAIAPSDDHYQPYGRSLTIPHTDYFLLGGGHDADTYLLYGQGQYNRVRFTENPGGFKALAYLYQGNHGQFNTVWADRDRGWLNSLLLNRRPLLSGEEQREMALVLITAFLEASVRDEEGYRALFANPPAGNAWLPEGIVVTQYASDSFAALDLDRPEPVSNVQGAPDEVTWVLDMTTAEMEPLLLRDGITSQQNEALHLTWAAGDTAVLSIPVDDDISVTADDALTFALAPASEVAFPLAITIELAANNGETARLPVNQFGTIYPPLPAKLVKADWLAPLPGYKMTLETPVENVLQTYTIPLTVFQEINPALNLAGLQEVRFLFDGREGGAIYLDQVGFTDYPQ